MSGNSGVGGFIITFDRADTLIETINSVLKQTICFKVLWIIDNGDSPKVLQLLESVQNKIIKYHQVGYNAGPAGAARIGLELCYKDNLEWIYWGDDDDPPLFKDTIEKLIQTASNYPLPGIIGAVGHFFDPYTGKIIRTNNDQLDTEGGLIVDSIAGNMTMIVHSNVIEKGVLPDDDLFFGFEELDFCLRVKKLGFDILVDKKIFKRHREFFNRTDVKIKIYKKKPIDKLWREYYSTRNLLYISRKNHFFIMKLSVLLKSVFKIIYGFRYGFKYGFRNSKMISYGILHFFVRKMGNRNLR
ncbi:hypothetical protein GCM10007049_00660 [Echinicola pacifica]|uniref:Glycosyltransferase 2-like domain-containing protein n=1 Tax=Echinicola pacifica TaxID=346377 RepID=A0A918PKJ8_9BACT|nr:glycosyltransferase [Echinicola pacifica]GGZ12826.1 hypothetical protein GCM10007049_00660 [Echinicola pacifica]